MTPDITPVPSASNPRITALLDTLRRSYDGDAWHGPALADALDGVDAATAAARPIPGAHSIWELVLHLTVWTAEVARRAGGAVAGMPAEGNWRSAPQTPDAPAWEAARRDLDAARDTLLTTVAALPADQLDRDVPRADPGNADVGPQTYALMLTGLAEHNAYHGGQIALLRRAAAAMARTPA